MRRNSLAHVARGVGRGAVLPVAGLALRRGEVPLGDAAARRHRHPDLARGGRAGRRPAARWPRCAARGCAPRWRCVWDWESWWALELEWRPVGRPALPGAGGRLLRGAVARQRHRRLRPPGGRPVGGYRLVVAPSLYLVPGGRREEPAPVRRAAAGTCWCRTSPASSTTRRHPPRRLPRRAARRARPHGRGVPPAARPATGGRGRRPARRRLVRAGRAARRDAVRRYVDGPAAGEPAVTRHDLGAGRPGTSPRGWTSGLADVLEPALAGVEPRGLPETVEAVRRERLPVPDQPRRRRGVVAASGTSFSTAPSTKARSPSRRAACGCSGSSSAGHPDRV